MSAQTQDSIAPPGALRLAAGLILTSLLLVTAVRLDIVPPTATAAERRAEARVAPAAERMLRFADSSDGSVVVTDARTGDAIARIGREGSGFIRGVMRGLARERRQHRIGAAPPFRLTLWRNGMLSLVDTATGRTVELDGFGPTNRAAFARFLKGAA
jgi:putative photosynthetic complex assembly protein